MTVTKSDIVGHLYASMGLNKREAKDVVESFFDSIRKTLATGEEVRLSGFGNFTLRDKRERPGRNPRTNEPIAVSSRRVVIFHPGQLLREHCNPDLPPRSKVPSGRSGQK
ncbi:integration host factor subunit alpha [Acidithiobacillus ferrooxidans]|uniref:integration host factor subunit alpha n=1 Tax=Acidithiobacillus ferridurans TaxID=1232575 RepID=UPI001C07CA41|nr:integration host factor subunit alpha [Acidithiobacillus ferridurans]MBU2805646.1 integration host factor subunit alpha [Acidithiobacillus ferridurans]MBU2823599.1 integration host factor subunit alpha [Acidithiobacillus ferrooxidans]